MVTRSASPIGGIQHGDDSMLLSTVKQRLSSTVKLRDALTGIHSQTLKHQKADCKSRFKLL